MANKLYRKTTKTVGGVDTPKLNEIATFNSECTFDGKTPLGYDAVDNSIKPISDLGDITIENLHVTGDTELDNQVIVNKDLNVKGNLIVDGSTIITDEQTLETNSDYAVLRKSKPTSLSSTEKSGIVVNNYDGNKAASIAVDQDGIWRISDNVAESTSSYTDTSKFGSQYYSGITQATSVTVADGAITSQDADEFSDTVYYNDVYYHFNGTHWYSLSLVNNILTKSANPIEDSATITALEALTKNTLIYYRTFSVLTISDATNQPILTRNEASNMDDGTVLIWDATDSKAITSKDAVIDYEASSLPNSPKNQIYGIPETDAVSNLKLKKLVDKYFDFDATNNIYVPKKNILSTDLTIGSDTNVNVTTISADLTRVNSSIITTGNTLVSGNIDVQKFYAGKETGSKYFTIGGDDSNGSGLSIECTNANCSLPVVTYDPVDEVGYISCGCAITYNPSNGALSTTKVITDCVDGTCGELDFSSSAKISNKNGTSYLNIDSTDNAELYFNDGTCCAKLGVEGNTINGRYCENTGSNGCIILSNSESSLSSKYDDGCYGLQLHNATAGQRHHTKLYNDWDLSGVSGCDACNSIDLFSNANCSYTEIATCENGSLSCYRFAPESFSVNIRPGTVSDTSFCVKSSGCIVTSYGCRKICGCIGCGSKPQIDLYENNVCTDRLAWLSDVTAGGNVIVCCIDSTAVPLVGYNCSDCTFRHSDVSLSCNNVISSNSNLTLKVTCPSVYSAPTICLGCNYICQTLGSSYGGATILICCDCFTATSDKDSSYPSCINLQNECYASLRGGSMCLNLFGTHSDDCACSNIYWTDCMYGYPSGQAGNMVNLTYWPACGLLTYSRCANDPSSGAALPPVCNVIDLKTLGTGMVTIANKAAVNANTPVALCTGATSLGRSTGCSLNFNTCTGALAAAMFCGSLCGTSTNSCKVYKTSATANTARQLLLGEGTESAGFGCVFFGNNCKATFNPGTGVLTASYFCGSFCGTASCAMNACCATDTTCFAKRTYDCAKDDIQDLFSTTFCGYAKAYRDSINCKGKVCWTNNTPACDLWKAICVAAGGNIRNLTKASNAFCFGAIGSISTAAITTVCVSCNLNLICIGSITVCCSATANVSGGVIEFVTIC